MARALLAPEEWRIGDAPGDPRQREGEGLHATELGYFGTTQMNTE
jgi:hypothetical protein